MSPCPIYRAVTLVGCFRRRLVAVSTIRFARRDDGRADVFIHVDQFVEDVQNLSVGGNVSFGLGTDPRTGRPEAKLVTLIE